MNCIVSAECIVQFEDNVVVSCIPLSEILSNTPLAATKQVIMSSKCVTQLVSFAIDMTPSTHPMNAPAQTCLASALQITSILARTMFKEIRQVTLRIPEPPSQVASQSLIRRMSRRQRARTIPGRPPVLSLLSLREHTTAKTEILDTRPEDFPSAASVTAYSRSY